MEEEHCLSAGLLKRRDYILPNCCYLLTYVLTYSLLSESFVPSSDRRSVDTRFIVQCRPTVPHAKQRPTPLFALSIRGPSHVLTSSTVAFDLRNCWCDKSQESSNGRRVIRRSHRQPACAVHVADGKYRSFLPRDAMHARY